MPHLHLYAINCLKMSENSIRNVYKILLGRNVTTSEVCNSSSDQVFAWTDFFLLLFCLFLMLHRSDLQYILHNLDKMLITSDIKHILKVIDKKIVFNIKQFDLFFFPHIFLLWMQINYVSSSLYLKMYLLNIFPVTIHITSKWCS